MPLPLIPMIAGALVGSVAKPKPKKRVAVNGRTRKDGTRGKAYTRRAKGD
jgi:hypothetical protein